jgi:hypothetical protein
MGATMCSACGGPADSAKVGSGIPPLGSRRILRLGAGADDGVGMYSCGYIANSGAGVLG